MARPATTEILDALRLEIGDENLVRSCGGEGCPVDMADIPSPQTRIERVGDDADLEEVYGTERHLLYVACTRARDRLLVTGVDPGSEFLDDLRAGE